MSDDSAPAAAPPAPASNLPPPAADAAHAAVTAATSDKDTTVLSSPADFTVKHPLYSPWTLWFDSASKQDKAKSWEESLARVISFQSVEDFWGLYNNIVPPSTLGQNANYYLFKEGIKPAWEDDANAQGGKWSVQLPRGKYTDQIDRVWLYTMLAAIGETFETPYVSPSAASPDAPSSTAPAPLPSTFSNEITGVIVSTRKAFFRINIWTRSASPQAEERVKNIGRHFKYGVLGFKEGLSFAASDKVSSDVEFQSHKDSQQKYGSKSSGGGGGKWTV
ncbi:eukaryotic translation initiation factor 4E [Rhodotorula kratochvilovae]